MEGAACPDRNRSKPRGMDSESDIIHPLSLLNVKKCCPPPMSTGGRCQMVYLDNGQVVVGSESELHRYDTSKNTWYALHEHELPLKSFALAVYRSQLLLIGGMITILTASEAIPDSVTGPVAKPPPSKSEHITDKIWYLDDEHGWTESPLLSPMPSSHSNAAAVVDGDLLIVADGPGIIESNCVDIFNGKCWLQTVCVQGPPMNPIHRYSLKKYYVYMAIHNDHLYVLGEYLSLLTNQISYRYFGCVSVQSLLESSTNADKHALPTWMTVKFPDGCASNPIAYKGHFISVVASDSIFNNDNQELSIHVFVEEWGVVMSNPYLKFTLALPCVVKLPNQELMVMIGGDALVMSTVVPPYCPMACDTSITSFSLMALEDLAGIPILSQLRGKKLNQFKDQAGFRLYPVTETSPDPVYRYIFSWTADGRQRELTRKPSWQNFIQVLREIDLGELAKQIEDLFIQTCPPGPQQKKEVSAIDEVAAVHRDLESLFEELSGEQQPPAQLQVSAIAQKVAACRDRCYSAFNLLGKEKKAYESKIESLPKTPEDENRKRKLTNKDLPLLLRQLKLHAAKWREIGIHLGFLTGELASIEARPTLSHGAPLSWFVAMLEEWLQWAPGDNRGSTSFATLEDLTDALNEAGFGASAHDLKLKVTST